MQKFDYDYDTENDDLFLFNPKSKSRGSVELGSFILDFNSNKELVGIEILDASKVLKDMVDGKSINEIKILLETLKDCKVDIKFNGGLLLIRMLFISAKGKISPIMSMPSIKTTSPALEYA